jgi:hypothetical protein
MLDEKNGGWRLGSLLSLEKSSDYNKVIIRKDL